MLANAIRWRRGRVRCGDPTRRRYSVQPTRTYTYDVDTHGQLFLSSTKLKNFTNCYKDAAFLDFFYSRLRRNTPDSSDEGATEAGELRAQGYDWVSPCGPELNYVRAARTPIVFRSLSEGATPRDHPAVKPADAAERFAGVLHYGGTLTEPFRPDALRADLDGYLYHPSPQPSKKRSARERYGSYSLVGSALVLAKFREMDVGEDGSGSFLWRGRRWDFAALRPGDVG